MCGRLLVVCSIKVTNTNNYHREERQSLYFSLGGASTGDRGQPIYMFLTPFPRTKSKWAQLGLRSWSVLIIISRRCSHPIIHTFKIKQVSITNAFSSCSWHKITSSKPRLLHRPPQVIYTFKDYMRGRGTPDLQNKRLRYCQGATNPWSLSEIHLGAAEDVIALSGSFVLSTFHE